MTTYSLIKLNCPVCKTTFSSGSIGSCGFASKRTDFRPNYWGMNPVEFFYHLCPRCGFCASMKFIKKDIKHPEFIKKLKSLEPLNKENKLSEKLERAAVCAELMNELKIHLFNSFSLGNFWLEPYWWAEEDTNIKKYGKIVISYFEKAFNEKMVPEDQIYCYKYLIGEICRRVGETKKANEFFDYVINELSDDTNNKFYQLAVQQRNDPKEDL
ncbi:MAG: DUF2225 domain-containing protein [Promethearchaeota archaeon]|nr:MAG: DUF2225 domain-containing protein [Candidatus Lokiarchaeota archaeon]